MITWGDVIDIILYMFDIEQVGLAIILGFESDKLSKIRNGKQQPPPKFKDYLFSSVFDPNESNSPAEKIMGKGTPKFLLTRLKEDIESRHEEIRKDMDDCWEEKDYQKFVLTMLGRARKGPPSNNSKKVADTSDITANEDCNRKQKKVSLGETPSEQISRIFEQAVADYNIATYICKLPDYLNGDLYCAEDAVAFIDAIQANILGPFVHLQDEDIFKQISEFTTALEAYSCFLGMIRLSVSEKYGSLLKLAGLDCEIIGLIDDERNEIKNKLGDKVSTKEGTNAPSDSELEGRLTQLDFISSILLSHKRLCELFEEICPGKTILVFQ